MGLDKLELSAAEEKQRDVLNCLRVMEGLTDNPWIVLWDNGLSGGLGGRLCLWAGEPRREGRPTERTRKAQRALCSEQDILDACVALANIAEVVAPYAWERGLKDARSDERGLSSWLYCSSECIDELDWNSVGWKKLIKEVASFVNQFGLLHMTSRKGSFFPQGWLSHHLVEFAGGDNALGLDGFRARDEEMVRFHARSRASTRTLPEDAPNDLPQAMKEILEERKAEFVRRHPGRPGALDADAYYAERYRDSLKAYAKDFSRYPHFEEGVRDERKMREKLLEDRARLRRARENARAWGDCDKAQDCEKKIGEIDYRLSDLGADTYDLESAVLMAGERFESERESLEANGVWEVDLYAFYRCSLLVHDALEMLAAIDGDEAAFNRLLPKFHMDYLASEDGESQPWMILWFESAGSDFDNPKTENLPVECKVEAKDGKAFPGQNVTRGMGRCYGGGRWHAVLCEEGATAEEFRDLVGKNLSGCLDGLIEQGITANYKGRFAEPFGLGRDTCTYTVNDRDHDLFSTMWHALRLVANGTWALDLCRCEVCGRLIRVKRSKNGVNGRKTCGEACRQRKSRGSIDEEAVALKQRYLEYMGSSEAVCLGLSTAADMGEESDAELPHGLLSRVRSTLGL